MSASGATGSSAREQALVDLVRVHQAPIWRYLRFLGCDEALADDLAQETFVAVWRRPFEDRGPAASRAYLRRVARNLFLMAVRKRRARPALVDLEAAEAAWTGFDADDGETYRAALAACLETLPYRSRHALDLFYREGAGRSGVARTLGMTPDGVKTLMRRIRQALRACISLRIKSQ